WKRWPPTWSGSCAAGWSARSSPRRSATWSCSGCSTSTRSPTCASRPSTLSSRTCAGFATRWTGSCAGGRGAGAITGTKRGTAMSDQFGGLPTELAWKIFIDRYTIKDQDRNFQPGELAVVQTSDDPKWPKKELGRVVEVAAGGDRLEIELLTGADQGRRLVRRRHECDRPLETHVRQVAQRIARGLAAEIGRAHV